MRVSIGIPAHNEEANIGKLLSNLLEQHLPANMRLEEIIIVADGCTDQTVDIVKDYQRKKSVIKPIEIKKRRGLTSTFNTIIERAHSEILVVVNADTLPESGCLERLVKPFNNISIGGVVGIAKPINAPESIWGYIHHLFYKCNYLTEFLRVDFEGSCALRRDLVEKVPLDILDYEPYVDATIKRKGYRVICAPSAISYTKAPDKLGDFVNQRRRTFFMHLQTQRKLNINEPRLNFHKVMATILKNLNLSPKKLFWFLITVVLSAYCYFLAYHDLWKGRSHVKWKMVASTKALNNNIKMFTEKSEL